MRPKSLGGKIENYPLLDIYFALRTYYLISDPIYMGRVQYGISGIFAIVLLRLFIARFPVNTPGFVSYCHWRIFHFVEWETTSGSHGRARRAYPV